MGKSKAETLTELQQRCLACRKCSIGGKLIGGRLSNVWSNMSMKAQIMVIGQNPGQVEVELGRPFVGPSGHFFDRAIKDVLELDRSHFYISNCVRCFTPNNRGPTQDEKDNCQEFLDAEIVAVDPKLIVTLGGPSLEQLSGRRGIMRLHGKTFMSLRYSKPVLPLLHPSPLNMNSVEKREMFYKDLEALREYV